MANSSQRMPTSGSTANSQRVRKVSQPVSSSSIIPSAPGSTSGWLEDAMRRKTSLSSTTSAHSSRQRYDSPISNVDSPQADNRPYTLPVAQSLQALSNLPTQPPIHHSHSDPLYNARTPHSTPHRRNTHVTHNQTSASAYVNSMRAANAAHYTSSASSVYSAVGSPAPSVASVPASTNTFGQVGTNSLACTQRLANALCCVIVIRQIPIASSLMAVPLLHIPLPRLTERLCIRPVCIRSLAHRPLKAIRAQQSAMHLPEPAVRIASDARQRQARL
jgi:hypothetical protein